MTDRQWRIPWAILGAVCMAGGIALLLYLARSAGAYPWNAKRSVYLGKVTRSWPN